jgi:hypothetical protein
MAGIVFPEIDQYIDGLANRGTEAQQRIEREGEGWPRWAPRHEKGKGRASRPGLLGNERRNPVVRGVRRPPGPLLAVAGRSSPSERLEKVTARRPERRADEYPPGVVPCMPGPHGLEPFPAFAPGTVAFKGNEGVREVGMPTPLDDLKSRVSGLKVDALRLQQGLAASPPRGAPVWDVIAEEAGASVGSALTSEFLGRSRIGSKAGRALVRQQQSMQREGRGARDRPASESNGEAFADRDAGFVWSYTARLGPDRETSRFASATEEMDVRKW